MFFSCELHGSRSLSWLLIVCARSEFRLTLAIVMQWAGHVRAGTHGFYSQPIWAHTGLSRPSSDQLPPILGQLWPLSATLERNQANVARVPPMFGRSPPTLSRHRPNQARRDHNGPTSTAQHVAPNRPELAQWRPNVRNLPSRTRTWRGIGQLWYGIVKALPEISTESLARKLPSANIGATSTKSLLEVDLIGPEFGQCWATRGVERQPA